MTKSETTPVIAAELLEGKQLIERLSNPDDPHDWETHRIRNYRAWSHIEVALNHEAAPNDADADHHFLEGVGLATAQGREELQTTDIMVDNLLLRSFVPIFRDRRFKAGDVSRDSLKTTRMAIGDGLRRVRNNFENDPCPDEDVQAHYIGNLCIYAANLTEIAQQKLPPQYLLYPASIRERTGFPHKKTLANHDAYILDQGAQRKHNFRFDSEHARIKHIAEGHTVLDASQFAAYSFTELHTPTMSATINSLGEIVERVVQNQPLKRAEHESWSRFKYFASQAVSGQSNV